MDRKDFIDVLDRCRKKAFLDVTWSFSVDEDADTKICLDGDGFLNFLYVKSPFNVEDVERVKYGIDEPNEDYYFTIDMKNGIRLRIGESLDGKYILLQTGNMDDVYLYRG